MGNCCCKHELFKTSDVCKQNEGFDNSEKFAKERTIQKSGKLDSKLESHSNKLPQLYEIEVSNQEIPSDTSVQSEIAPNCKNDEKGPNSDLELVTIRPCLNSSLDHNMLQSQSICVRSNHEHINSALARHTDEMKIREITPHLAGEFTPLKNTKHSQSLSALQDTREEVDADCSLAVKGLRTRTGENLQYCHPYGGSKVGLGFDDSRQFWSVTKLGDKYPCQVLPDKQSKFSRSLSTLRDPTQQPGNGWPPSASSDFRKLMFGEKQGHFAYREALRKKHLRKSQSLLDLPQHRERQDNVSSDTDTRKGVSGIKLRLSSPCHPVDENSSSYSGDEATIESKYGPKHNMHNIHEDAEAKCESYSREFNKLCWKSNRRRLNEEDKYFKIAHELMKTKECVKTLFTLAMFQESRRKKQENVIISSLQQINQRVDQLFQLIPEMEKKFSSEITAINQNFGTLVASLVASTTREANQQAMQVMKEKFSSEITAITQNLATLAASTAREVAQQAMQVHICIMSKKQSYLQAAERCIRQQAEKWNWPKPYEIISKRIGALHVPIDVVRGATLVILVAVPEPRGLILSDKKESQLGAAYRASLYCEKMVRVILCVDTATSLPAHDIVHSNCLSLIKEQHELHSLYVKKQLMSVPYNEYVDTDMTLNESQETLLGNWVNQHH